MRIDDIKGAVFDIDGTLLDSMWIWNVIDEEFLQKRSIAVPTDYVEKISHMGMSECAKYTIERFGLKESESELIEEWNGMAEQAYRTRIELRNGARSYLESLAKRGVRLAAATSSNARLYEPALKRNGVYELFETIVTVDDVGRGKDCADVYLLAAKKIDTLPSECAVFEDIYTGIRSARAAGFYTVGIYEPHCTDERVEHEADLYIRTWEELLQK